MKKYIYSSVPDMLRKNALKFKDKPALKYRKQGKFVTLSYADFYNRALMVTRGLKKLKVQHGEKVAILSENRAGWVIADMGILCAGAVTVPIYPTSTPEQIEYMINHSGVRIIFVSGKYQYERLLKIRESIPGVELVISFERFLGESSLHVCTFYQMSEIDTPISAQEKIEIESQIDLVKPEDLITLIYTSGTTGTPKGVMLTHSNIISNVYYLTYNNEILTSDDVLLSFLPLSHILERTCGYYLTFSKGALMAFADSIEKVAENMLEVNPTMMVSVPRLFEKIYHRIFENVHKMPLLKKTLFHWAVNVGKEYVHAEFIDKKPCAVLKLKHAMAERLVFSKLKSLFGNRFKLFCSGGAPLDKTINEFFWSIGLPIYEGYGLTETSPAISFNNLENIRFGSVGKALPETEIKIAEDGEILVRGPQVMVGYYNNPEATAEAMENGWFKTGDIGRLEDGFLYITDRKKELIITAGGKNIAPQPIENRMKMDKFISSIFVYGDRKPYLIALIVPNAERLFEFAKEAHVQFFDINDLVTAEPVLNLYRERLAEINSELASYETIKKFALLAHDFSIVNGELTPTLKLRRKVVYEKHKQTIEDMYTDHSN